MRTSDSGAQISKLDARLRQLKKNERLARARIRRLDSQRARKDDTRRKILVGAIVLAKVGQGILAEAQLRQRREGTLKRADDRALFEL